MEQDNGDEVLFGQIGSGLLKFAGGGLAAAAGVGLCSTVGGCFAGGPMALIGGNNMIQGGTMMRDAWNGKHSNGINPLRDSMADTSPRWGGFAYDVADLGATAGSLFARTPLVVDKTVAGINRTNSMFGVKVPRMDNSVKVFGKVYDSNVARGILGAALLSKGYNAAQDFPDRE